MIAFLEKPAESNGFQEIIDFLNANQIHYALTVNLTIYTSCIEQFWATTKAKTVNGERQLQALVDKKKVKETEVPQDETHHDDSIPISSNDPLLNGEDRMQLTELMILCTNLQKQVLDLEKANDSQAKEIAGLKKRVQKLERKKKSRTTGLKRLRKVGESSRVASFEDKENDLHDDEVIVDMAVGEKQEQSAKVDER
ncbi:hypothetical protein Tco_0397100, partial [Tanacetum coccineum]